MFQKITNENFLLFAIKHYDNPQCVGEEEFYDDMKRFTYIKKLFSKYDESKILKERLILNHIIIITNLFGVDAGTTLLFFKTDQKYWTYLKTFLLYLNMLNEYELKEIPIDQQIKSILEKI